MSSAKAARDKRYYDRHRIEIGVRRKEYYAAHKTEITLKQRQRRMADPEKFRERDRARRRSNPEAVRAMNYKSKYGITLDEYDEMFDKQNGVCAICGMVWVGGKRLLVDHDHKTGLVRGLLCHRCNVALGLVGDDITLLSNLSAYLEKNYV